MHLDLHNKVACITGSTTGIGLGIARSFAKAGARLIINSHVEDELTEVALSELRGLTDCAFVKVDLSTSDGAKILIDRAAAEFGPLTTLVCNAGTFRDRQFSENTSADFDATFNLNVRSYLNAAQAFAAQCTDPEASILCIGSTNSKAAEKDSVYYDTSKGAVLMMIRSLAVTLADRGIRVNGIGPGIVETPLTAPGLNTSGARKKLTETIPLGRVGVPDDIGPAAAFLCSRMASYITGQMLYIDGGILTQQNSW